MSGTYAGDEDSRRKPRLSLATSGLMTSLLLALVLGALGVVWTAHMRGKLHRLTTTETPPDRTEAVRPGGQDVLRIHRMEHAGEMTPQITSAVVLPGDGMAMLQASITLPGRGPVPLLEGTPEANLQEQVNPLTDAVKPGLLASPISVRSQAGDGNQWGPAMELTMGRPAQQSSSDILPDGGAVNATFAPTSSPGSDGHAPEPGGVETTVSTLVTGRGLDLTVTARNVSESPRAVSITWGPRFVAPKSGLKDMSITLPVTAGASTGGKNDPQALALGGRDVHELYSGLKHTYLSPGPEVQLRNASEGYTLHLTALTPSIRSLRVDALKGGKSVLLAFSTAAGDSPGQSHTVVLPGETLQWHVRVEATANVAYTSTAE